MSRIDRALAARFVSFHDRQENQESANVLEADGAKRFGVAMKNWGGGLITRRAATFPEHQSANFITGFGRAHFDRIDDLVAWFDAAGCACHLAWPGHEVDDEASAVLAARGFLPTELEAWLAAPIGKMSTKAPPHDIRLVAKEADAAVFARAVCAGWNVPDGPHAEAVAAALGCWPGPADWRRYVAFVDNQVAGEALLTLFGDVAYLAEASTVPAFRRRGVQRALIARRVEDARAAGARIVFGAVTWGDQSWANMSAMGLREEWLTLTWKRPPASAG